MHNIAVVGCGAIGLTSALAIQSSLNNTNVTIFARDLSPYTTSDIAAGLWEPYLLQDTPEEKIFQWAKATHDYLLRQWKEGIAKEAGITLQPAIYLTTDQDYKLPGWLNIVVGYSELSKEKLVELGEKYNQELTGGFSFITFTWEASIFLPFLEQEFTRNGGKIVKKEIKQLKELDRFDVVVNCTGLGSRKLTGDFNVRPIRGQVIRVKAPWIYHITVVDTKKPFYIIPNTHSVVLGGTKQQEFNLEIDERDTEDILRIHINELVPVLIFLDHFYINVPDWAKRTFQRSHSFPTENCSALVPAVKSAEIIKHQVGLRPARDNVRLETEIKGDKKNGLRIVHNYGHGGAGITLSVGCAAEAAELVGELLQEEHFSSKL